MTFVFKHPKYYTELRKRNKSDQAISLRESETSAGERAPGQGLKRQASSDKRIKQQATSVKPQAASFKLQAASYKLQDLRTTKKFHGARTEVLNADEGVVWMLHMEGYLVWWKFNLITFCNFKFYSEKVARSIVAQ